MLMRTPLDNQTPVFTIVILAKNFFFLTLMREKKKIERNLVHSKIGSRESNIVCNRSTLIYIFVAPVCEFPTFFFAIVNIVIAVNY